METQKNNISRSSSQSSSSDLLSASRAEFEVSCFRFIMIFLQFHLISLVAFNPFSLDLSNLKLDLTFSAIFFALNMIYLLIMWKFEQLIVQVSMIIGAVYSIAFIEIFRDRIDFKDEIRVLYFFFSGIAFNMIYFVLSLLDIKSNSGLVVVTLLNITMFVRYPSYMGGYNKYAMGAFHLVLNLAGMFLLSYKHKKVQEIIIKEHHSKSNQIDSFDSILKKLAYSMVFVLKEDRILFNNESVNKNFFLNAYINKDHQTFLSGLKVKH